MKSIISAMGNYIDQKKAERTAETKAWREASVAIAKADAQYDAAVEDLNKAWGELDASCAIKDPIASEAIGETAAKAISKGMEAIEEASIALDKAEAAALDLAKGQRNFMLSKTKYMPLPSSLRQGPYI